MRSSFGSSVLPWNMPSLFIDILHSPSGLPAAAVFFEDLSVIRKSGSGSWKYHHNVAQSIMAICLDGEWAGLKS
jgi:hypothetical protein